MRPQNWKTVEEITGKTCDEIKQMLLDGLSLKEFAEQYNIKHTTMGQKIKKECGFNANKYVRSLTKRIQEDDLFAEYIRKPSMSPMEKYKLGKKLFKKYPKGHLQIAVSLNLDKVKFYGYAHDWLDDPTAVKTPIKVTPELKAKAKKELKKDNNIYRVGALLGISETVVRRIRAEMTGKKEKQINKTAYKTLQHLIKSMKACGYKEWEIYKTIEEIEHRNNVVNTDWFTTV